MTLWRRSLLSCLVLLLPSFAVAQPRTSSGPMTVERMHNGFSAAGDVKLTEIDDHASALVGGQAGWVFEEALFLGGGGYWLANGSHDRGLAYGGLVTEWRFRTSDRLGFAAKTLIGGGQATLTQRVAGRAFRPSSVRFEQYVFVAEPEANVSLRVMKRVRLTGGVGYRFVGALDGFNDDRFGGPTGSVGFRIS